MSAGERDGWSCGDCGRWWPNGDVRRWRRPISEVEIHSACDVATWHSLEMHVAADRCNSEATATVNQAAARWHVVATDGNSSKPLTTLRKWLLNFETQAPTPPWKPGTLPRHSPTNRGKHHVWSRYLSGTYFDFWSESAIIALITFTKCSPFSRINWLILVISHFKMLHDGIILSLANYVYTYSLYARTMIFFCWSALAVRLNTAPVIRRLWGGGEGGVGGRGRENEERSWQVL